MNSCFKVHSVRNKLEAISKTQWFVVACIGYAFAAFYYTHLRYLTLCANVFDLGIFDQVIWNISQFRGQTYSLETGHFLNQHFCPILYLLAIPYWIGLGGPTFLLVIQTFSIALSAWLFARVANEVLELRQEHAIVFALLYLFSTAVQNAQCFDFHPVCFLPPLLLGIVLTAHRSSYGFLILWIILASLIKEHVGLILIFLGGALILHPKMRRSGLIVAMAGVSIFLIVSTFGYYWGIGQGAVIRYSWTGASSMLELPLKLLSQPMLVLQKVFGDFHGLHYLFRLLIPVVGLCLIKPIWLLPAVPILLVNILADNDLSRSFNFHYQINIILWIFIAAASSWKTVSTRLSRLHKTLPLVLLLFVCFSDLYDLKNHGRLFPFCDKFKDDTRSKHAKTAASHARQAVLDMVPANASLAATGTFCYPEMLHRVEYYMLPFDGLEEADYLLVDIKKPFWIKEKAKTLLDDLQALQDSGELEIISRFENRWLLLQRVTLYSQ